MTRHTPTHGFSLGAGAVALCAVVALAASPLRGHLTSAEGSASQASLSSARTHTPHTRSPRHVTAQDGIDLARARLATADFRHVEAAERAGYALPEIGPLHQCITDYNNTGAMGYHFINGTNAGDTVVDPTKPEALVYHRTGNGRLVLGALEYVVFAKAWDAEHQQPPEIFGQQMMKVDTPNRYELPAFYMLHVWLWTTNPKGIFTPFNPAVKCHC